MKALKYLSVVLLISIGFAAGVKYEKRKHVKNNPGNSYFRHGSSAGKKVVNRARRPVPEYEIIFSPNVTRCLNLQLPV